MIVEPQSVSVCGSDVRIFRYGNKRVVPPTVIGHEFAGRVVKVGKKVKNWKMGDRITMGADVPDMGTGREYTLKGMGNLTPENLAIGYQLDGAFQQKMVLDENSVKYGPIVRIPDHLPDDDACITEPLACAIHGLEMARMGLGKSIAVIGLGPIGCMVLELSRYYGASRVFAIQRSKKRLEMARQFRTDARFIAASEEDPIRFEFEPPPAYRAVPPPLPHNSIKVFICEPPGDDLDRVALALERVCDFGRGQAAALLDDFPAGALVGGSGQGVSDILCITSACVVPYQCCDTTDMGCGH